MALTDRSVAGPTMSTIAVIALAFVVLGGSVLAYLDFQDSTTVDAAAIDDQDSVQDLTQTTPPVPTASPSAPSQSWVSLWIGDGYTDRTACGAAEVLGWSCTSDGQPGTGFIADGSAIGQDDDPLRERLATYDELLDPDVVVIDAGRNDLQVDPVSSLLSALADYVDQVRTAYPDAILVQVVPWTATQERPLRNGVPKAITVLMRKYGGFVVDPYDLGWAGAGQTDVAGLVNERGDLSAEGFDYVQEQLAQAISELDLETAG